MAAKPHTSFLRAAACLFAVAALFHLSRVFLPQAGDPSGALRHAVFVGINLGCVGGLILQPPFFRVAFIALAAQQAYSHGGTAWMAWVERGEVDLVSLVIVVLMPAILAALWWSDSSRTIVGSLCATALSPVDRFDHGGGSSAVIPPSPSTSGLHRVDSEDDQLRTHSISMSSRSPTPVATARAAAHRFPSRRRDRECRG
jgi:hypothetical protein